MSDCRWPRGNFSPETKLSPLFVVVLDRVKSLAGGVPGLSGKGKSLLKEGSRKVRGWGGRKAGRQRKKDEQCGWVKVAWRY